MRTNIDLDDDLILRALKLSSSGTKRGVVHEALAEYVAARERKDLRELAGKIRFKPGYDHKALRGR